MRFEYLLIAKELKLFTFNPQRGFYYHPILEMRKLKSQEVKQTATNQVSDLGLKSTCFKQVVGTIKENKINFSSMAFKQAIPKLQEIAVGEE